VAPWQYDSTAIRLKAVIF